MLKSRIKEDLKVSCFRCKEEFLVKYNYPRKSWVLINNWGYWTEKEENKEKYICNSCLKKFYYENKKEYWKTITSPAKRSKMRTHIYFLTKQNI